MNEEIKEETTIKEENIYEKWVIGKYVEEEPDEIFCSKVKAGEYKFNFAAFFLGAPYYAYRKCYAEAFAYAFIYVLLGILEIFSPDGASIMFQMLSLALYIGGGFLFYPVYKKKLDKYMEEKKDPKKYGGTSILSFLLYFLLIFGVVLGIVMLILEQM